MDLDRSDILGQDTMPVVQDSNFLVARDSNSLLSVKKLFFLCLTLSLIYVAGIRLWKRFLLWRERSYKLWVIILRVISDFQADRTFFLVRRDADMAFRTMIYDLSTWLTLMPS